MIACRGKKGCGKVREREREKGDSCVLKWCHRKTFRDREKVSSQPPNQFELQCSFLCFFSLFLFFFLFLFLVLCVNE